MPAGWRIVRAERLAAAFAGEGARLFPGRWNSRGTPMVYASEHQSLAALELFVHWRPLLAREKFLAIPTSWHSRLTEFFQIEALPRDWRINPAGPPTRAIGDDWVRQARSAVLSVPSALVPAERNFLFNPAHPDFAKIEIGPAITFEFDQRPLG